MSQTVSLTGALGPFSNPTGTAVGSIVITFAAQTNAANNASQTIAASALPASGSFPISQALEADTYVITGQTFDNSTPPVPLGPAVAYAKNPLVVTAASNVEILVSLS